MRQGDFRFSVVGCRFNVIAVLLLVVGVCFGRYSGGTGEPNNPYLIATANDLNSIGLDSNDWDKQFKMIADINMSGYLEYNIICGEPTGAWCTQFEGVFDGNNHTISNLTINENRSMVGLFGYVGQNSIIQNTNLETIDYKGIHYVGGVTGRNEGKILNCHVLGIIEGDQTCGGISGYSSESQIINCSFRGEVHGNLYTGGIGGSTWNSEISECYAIADINGVVHCGGVVGRNDGSNLSRCFAKGAIFCSGNTAGGVVGYSSDSCGGRGGKIHDCYADVIVNCSINSGGFCGSGLGPSGEIRNCYCTGKVIYDVGDYSDIGGLIGKNNRAQGVFNSFFLESSGPDNGFGEALTSVQMQKRKTFSDAGWDFIDVWGIGEGQTYPFLRKYLAGDMNHDGIVDGRDFAIFANQWLEGV